MEWDRIVMVYPQAKFRAVCTVCDDVGAAPFAVQESAEAWAQDHANRTGHTAAVEAAR